MNRIKENLLLWGKDKREFITLGNLGRKRQKCGCAAAEIWGRFKGGYKSSANQRNSGEG